MVQHKRSVALRILLGLEQSERLDRHHLDRPVLFQLSFVVDGGYVNGSGLCNEKLCARPLLPFGSLQKHICREDDFLGLLVSKRQLLNLFLIVESKNVGKDLLLLLSLLLFEAVLCFLSQVLLLLNNSSESRLAGPADMQGILTCLQIDFDELCQALVDARLEFLERLLLAARYLLPNEFEEVVDSGANRTNKCDGRFQNLLNLLQDRVLLERADAQGLKLILILLLDLVALLFE